MWQNCGKHSIRLWIDVTIRGSVTVPPPTQDRFAICCLLLSCEGVSAKMNAVGAISELLKDLEIEFELKAEQKSIIKAIINREDDFCRFTHVHFRIKYRPKEFATSCLKVICI